MRCLSISNFTNEHNIRIVAENGPQPTSEGKPGLLRNLDLVHAPELILNGVLDRNDLADLVVDLVEGRVKSRGLAAAGRACHQHYAVWQIEHLLKTLQLAVSKTDMGQAPQGRVLPQQTHDHRLAMKHGND